MYTSLEKVREVFKRELPVLSVVIEDAEFPLIFSAVSEILSLEANALAESEPYAYNSVTKLHWASYELSNMAYDLEEITG